MDLTVVWALILAFIVAMYVVMDGFDLGIGILFPRFRVGKERDMAMNSVAPVWDGNETWLILGGNGLIAAFPVAYAIILPALYAPLIAMLLGLIFRGVAFEFRWRDPGHRRWWDAGFFLGSLVATLAQGITLGALLQGITIEGRAYGGGWWDWLTPFTLLVGASLVVGYALLGACWLVWKTEGPLHDQARRYALMLLPALLVAFGAVSLATPFLEGKYAERWFEAPGLFVPCRCRCWFWNGVGRLAGAEARAGPCSIPVGAGAVRPVAARSRHLDLARRHPRTGLDLAGGGALRQPALHAGRLRGADPADPRLHRLVLLRIPRQGRARGLS
jgi:cytochrome d ubiquinol oxidase subunit II